jgi:hypothetical protein
MTNKVQIIHGAQTGVFPGNDVWEIVMSEKTSRYFWRNSDWRIVSQ